jgi:hypothetical protein
MIVVHSRVSAEGKNALKRSSLREWVVTGLPSLQFPNSLGLRLIRVPHPASELEAQSTRSGLNGEIARSDKKKCLRLFPLLQLHR